MTLFTNLNACSSMSRFISRLQTPPQWDLAKNVQPISLWLFSWSYPWNRDDPMIWLSLASRAINAPPDSRASPKNPFEDRLFVTVPHRMLFPDQWIRSYSVKGLKISWPKWPEAEKLAFQNWLELKRHSSFSHFESVSVRQRPEK